VPLSVSKNPNNLKTSIDWIRVKRVTTGKSHVGGTKAVQSRTKGCVGRCQQMCQTVCSFGSCEIWALKIRPVAGLLQLQRILINNIFSIHVPDASQNCCCKQCLEANKQLATIPGQESVYTSLNEEGRLSLWRLRHAPP
jgi:hypothetical protein